MAKKTDTQQGNISMLGYLDTLSDMTKGVFSFDALQSAIQDLTTKIKEYSKRPDNSRTEKETKELVENIKNLKDLKKLNDLVKNYESALAEVHNYQLKLEGIYKDKSLTEAKKLEKLDKITTQETKALTELTQAILSLRSGHANFSEIEVVKKVTKDKQPARDTRKYDQKTNTYTTKKAEGKNERVNYEDFLKKLGKIFQEEYKKRGMMITEEEGYLKALLEEIKNMKSLVSDKLIYPKLNEPINFQRSTAMSGMAGQHSPGLPTILKEMFDRRTPTMGTNADNPKAFIKNLASEFKSLSKKADEGDQEAFKNFNKLSNLFGANITNLLLDKPTLSKTDIKTILKESQSRKITNGEDILPALSSVGINFQQDIKTKKFAGQGRLYTADEIARGRLQLTQTLAEYPTKYLSHVSQSQYATEGQQRKTGQQFGSISEEQLRSLFLHPTFYKAPNTSVPEINKQALLSELNNEQLAGITDGIMSAIYKAIMKASAEGASFHTPGVSPIVSGQIGKSTLISSSTKGKPGGKEERKNIDERRAAEFFIENQPSVIPSKENKKITSKEPTEVSTIPIADVEGTVAAELEQKKIEEKIAEEAKVKKEAEKKAKEKAESKAKKEAEKKRIAAEKAAKEIKKAEELAKTEISTAKQIDEEAKKTVEALTHPAGSGEPPKRKPRKKKEDLPVYGLAELEPIFKSILVNMEAIKKILMEQLNIQKKVADLISGKFIATVQQAINDEGGAVGGSILKPEQKQQIKNIKNTMDDGRQKYLEDMIKKDQYGILKQGTSSSGIINPFATTPGDPSKIIIASETKGNKFPVGKTKMYENMFKQLDERDAPQIKKQLIDNLKRLQDYIGLFDQVDQIQYEKEFEQLLKKETKKEERKYRKINYPIFENDKNMRINQIQTGIGSGFTANQQGAIYPFSDAGVDITTQTGRGGERIGHAKEWLGIPLKDLKEAGELLNQQKIALDAVAKTSDEIGTSAPFNIAMMQLNKNLDMVNSEMTVMEDLMKKMGAIELDPKKFTPEELNKKQEELNELTDEYMKRLRSVEQIKEQSRATTNQIADLQTKHIDKLNEKEKERASILAAQQAIQGRQDVISKYGTEITKKLDPVMMDQAKRGISGISPTMTSTIATYAASAKSDMEKNNEQLKFYKQSEVNLKNIIDLEKNLAELRAMQEKGVSGDEQVKQYKKIQDIVQNIEVQRADSAKIIKNIEEDNQKQLKQTLKLTGKLFDYEKEIAEYKDDQVGKEHAIKELRLQTDAFEELTKTMRNYGTDSKNIDDGRINALQKYLTLTEKETNNMNVILAAHGKQVTSLEDVRNIQAKIIKFQEIQKNNNGKMTDESIRLYEEIVKGVVHVENVSRKAGERTLSAQLDQQQKMKEGVDALTATWMKHLGSVTRTMKSSLNSLFGNILRIKIILGTIGYTLQREIKEGLIRIYRISQQIVQTTEQISIMKTTLGDIFSPSANLNNEAFANTLVESVAKVTIGLGDMDGKIKRIPVSFAEAVTSIKGMAAIPGLKSFFFGRGTGDMSPDAIDAKVGNLLKAVQALQLIDPSQGVEGAMFSLREALSGDFISLKRRFEIQPHFLSQAIGKSVEELKNDPNLFLEGLSEYFESNFASVFEKMVQNPQGLIESIRSSIQYLMNAVGSGPKGLLKMVSERILMPVRDLFIGFLQSNEFKRITVLIQDKYANIFNSLQKLFDPSKFSGVLVDVFSTLFGTQMNTGGNQFSSLEKSIQVISEFIDEGIEKSIKYVIQNKGQILSLIENIKVMVGQIVKFIIPFGDKFMNTILPGMLKLLEWVSSNSFLMMLSTLAMLLGVGNTISGIGGMIQFGGAALVQQAMAHAVTPGKGVVSQLFGKTLGLEVAGQYLLSGSHGANAINRLAGVDVSKMASEKVEVARYLADQKAGLITSTAGGSGTMPIITGSIGGGATDQKAGLITSTAGGSGTMPIITGSIGGGATGMGSRAAMSASWAKGGIVGKLGAVGHGIAGVTAATLKGGPIGALIAAGIIGIFKGADVLTEKRKGIIDDDISLMITEGEYRKQINKQLQESTSVFKYFTYALQEVSGLMGEFANWVSKIIYGDKDPGQSVEKILGTQIKGDVFHIIANQLRSGDKRYPLNSELIRSARDIKPSLIQQEVMGAATQNEEYRQIKNTLRTFQTKIEKGEPITSDDIVIMERMQEQFQNLKSKIGDSFLKEFTPIVENIFKTGLAKTDMDQVQVEKLISIYLKELHKLGLEQFDIHTKKLLEDLQNSPQFKKAIDAGLIQAEVSTLVARIEQSNIGFSEYVNTLMGLQDQIRWMVPTKAQMLMRKNMGKQAEAMEALLASTPGSETKFALAFKNFNKTSQVEVDKMATGILGMIISKLGDNDKYKTPISKLIELGTKDYDLANESDLVEILKIINDSKFKELFDLIFTTEGLNLEKLKNEIPALSKLVDEIKKIKDADVKGFIDNTVTAFKKTFSFDRKQLIKQYMELTGKDFEKVVQAQKKALIEMQLQSPTYSGIIQNIMDARKELEKQAEIEKTIGTDSKLSPTFQIRKQKLGSIFNKQIQFGVDQYVALLEKDIMEINKAVQFSRGKTATSVLTSALKAKEMLAKAEIERVAALEVKDIAESQTAQTTESERTKTLTKLTPVLFKQYMTQMNRDFEKQVIGFKYLDTHKPEDIEKYIANLSQVIDTFNPEELRLVAGKSLAERDYTALANMRDQLGEMLNDSQIVLVEAYMGMMDKTIRSLSNEAKRQMTQLENMTAKIPKGSKWDQYKVDFGGRSIVPRYGSSGTFASSGYFAKGGLYGTNQETLREMARYSGMLRSESTTSMSIKARKMGTQQFVDKFSQMLPQAKETFERIFPEMIAASEKKMEELKIQMDKAGETHKNYEILKGQLRDVEAQHEEILASQKESFLSLEKATEEYNKMVDMLGDNSAFKAFHEGLMNMYRDFSNFEEQLALSFNNTGQILGRTMDDFFFNVFKGQIQDAKQVWSGFMRSIWDEFARTLSKMMSQNIIKGLFGGLMGEGSFGGGTGWLTNLFGSFGGGTKPTSGLDSIRTKITQLPTSARANGGLITRPELALLGEGRNNPEVVMNNTQLHQHLQSVVSRTIGEMKPRMGQTTGKSIQMTNNFRFEVTGSTNQETQDNMQKMILALPEMINEQVRMTINEDDNVQESIRGIARQSYV